MTFGILRSMLARPRVSNPLALLMQSSLPVWLFLLIALVWGSVFPSPARAVVDDIPIVVDDEEDLRFLLENGDIGMDSYERLVALLERPLDLNRAGRRSLYDLPGLTYSMIDALLAYREEQPLRAVSDLSRVGIPDDVIRQVRPFVTIARRPRRPPVVTGNVQLRGVGALGDGKTPAFLLRPRATLFSRVDVGLAMVLQDRPGPFAYHRRDGLTWLTADPPGPRVQVPRFFVSIDEPGWAVIVGSYQAGFGQRLVFDATSRLEPHGFYPDDLVPEYEESATFGVRERLYGVAGRLKNLTLGGGGALDATLFFSYWPFDAAQNDVVSRLRPLDDSVYLHGGGPNPLFCERGVAPESCARDGVGRISSSRLRAAFTELLIGGNVTYLPTPHWEVMGTGYFAKLHWLESDDLHFTSGARFPDRGRIGAFGLSVKGRMGPFSVFSEYARTASGGNAAMARAIFGRRRVDVELAGRFYDRSFDNPHSRGPASPQYYEGNRDRDEAGGNLRLNVRPTNWLAARVEMDMWYRLSLDYTSLRFVGRIDVEPWRWLTISSGVDLTDKDITTGGRGQTYTDRFITEAGEELRDVGRGMSLSVWGQLRADVFNRVRLLFHYRSKLYDTRVTPRAYAYPDGVCRQEQLEAGETLCARDIRGDLVQFYSENFAQDLNVHLTTTVRVIDPLQLAARVRYFNAEVDFLFRGERFVESWFQMRWRALPFLHVQFRYRVRAHLDERDEIQAHWGPSTNPEHLFKGTLEGRF